MQLAQSVFIHVVGSSQGAGSNIDITGRRFVLRVHPAERTCSKFEFVDEGLDFGYSLESRWDGVLLLVEEATVLDLWCSKPRVYEDIEVYSRMAIVPGNLDEP